MRNLYLITFKSILFLMIIFSIQSCIEKAGVKIDGQISSSKREDFHELNNLVIKCLKSSDNDSLKFIMSKEMIENDYTVHEANSLGTALKLADYSLLNEYYIVKDKAQKDSVTTIAGPVKGKGAYNLSF